MLINGCSTSAVQKPIILTNSQLECKDKPPLPGPEFIERDEEGRLTKEAERIQSLFLTGMEYAYDDCRDQLSELKTYLNVQGAEITDVPLETPDSEKSGPFGLW